MVILLKYNMILSFSRSIDDDEEEDNDDYDNEDVESWASQLYKCCKMKFFPLIVIPNIFTHVSEYYDT